MNIETIYSNESFNVAIYQLKLDIIRLTLLDIDIDYYYLIHLISQILERDWKIT